MHRRHIWTRVVVVSAAATVLIAPLAIASGTGSRTPGATTWTTRSLPPAAGTNLSRNEDGEPGMGVSPAGEFWIASDIAPYAAHDPRVSPGSGLLSGADVWSSDKSGRGFTWRSNPFAEAANKFGLAGEDTDLTVATQKNSNGFYNVYATSLWIGRR